ncbi:uncharacterized protein LOC115548658 [Gadus morhua]|uniref:uncharacterized protein LOC115548658 n=1 Tax=Gadus morhua TaxID=8049 RepID=UPI0011B7F01A|nr:uncharacterized protein LOC115548658 [Gadus morhua]
MLFSHQRSESFHFHHTSPVEVELMEETDSAVVAMAAELTQDQVSWTRGERDAVSFRSEVYDTGYFTVDILTFGRGTTLVVTDRPVVLSVVRPKVSVYPATGADLKGRRSLLCVARDMVPEEVRVSWRRRGGGRGGGKDGEQLELRAPTYAASILVIDQGETLTDQYNCTVEHESGRQEVEVPAEITLTSEGPGMIEMTLTTEGPGKTEVTLATAVTTDPRRPGRPREGPSDETHRVPESLQVLSRARLASVLYTVMVVKSVLCCCGLALLLLHTNKTSRTPRTSTTTALD